MAKGPLTSGIHFLLYVTPFYMSLYSLPTRDKQVVGSKMYFPGPAVCRTSWHTVEECIIRVQIIKMYGNSPLPSHFSFHKRIIEDLGQIKPITASGLQTRYIDGCDPPHHTILLKIHNVESSDRNMTRLTPASNQAFHPDQHFLYTSLLSLPPPTFPEMIFYGPLYLQTHHT